MKKSELEKYLGKRVKVNILGDNIVEGILHKTGEEEFKNDPNFYIPKNYYFVSPANNLIFRCSHVKSLKEVKL